MKEMKKVLFLMSLLFLMGLGAASMKAQVRIGGNGVPNAAAVLDLNATDATNNGTKGLALPRVNLTSNTMQLVSGVANLPGMLVYNTTATLGAGIYSWTGSLWKKVDAVPTTTPADSGKFLMSTGTGTVFSALRAVSTNNSDSIKTIQTLRPVTWAILVDTFVNLNIKANQYTYIAVQGLRAGDICVPTTAQQLIQLIAHTSNEMIAYTAFDWPITNNQLTFRCYRSSL